jgi:hypothetical protein
VPPVHVVIVISLRESRCWQDLYEMATVVLVGEKGVQDPSPEGVAAEVGARKGNALMH